MSLSRARRAVGHDLHGHWEALLAEAVAALAGWLEQWPDGDHYLPGLLAQDVQAVVYARFDPLWPLCPTCVTTPCSSSPTSARTPSGVPPQRPADR